MNSLENLLKRTIVYRIYHEYKLKRLERLTEIRKQYFKKEGCLLLEKFSEALNDNGIIFWLEFGTLLGYYREHDFIAHDCDLDFGVNLCDADRVRKALENNGFKRIILFESSDGGMEECYKYKHTTLDVFYFREKENELYCTSYSKFVSRIRDRFTFKKPCTVKKICVPKSGFKRVKYKGCEVYVPIKIEEHLIMHYGKTFMVPNPQFNYKKDASNIIYYNYSDVYGYSIQYEKKI